MWQGVIPAVTTKFTESGGLDFTEMTRCYALMMQAGCDGLIACGSLGEGPMLSHDERLDVFRTVKDAAGTKPALLTVAEASTLAACRLAERGAKAGASGLMVVPSTIYPTNREETLAVLREIASAGGLPVMVYSNRLAYRVDVSNDMLLELSEDRHFVAVKESSDDIRRTVDAVGLLKGQMKVLTGVDNLAFEAIAVGADGWIAGLVCAFPKETVAIWRLMQAGRQVEALAIYRWFRPLLDLDASSYLVHNIKLAEAVALGSNERMRAPRLPLSDDRRAAVEATIRAAIASRPELPSI